MAELLMDRYIADTCGLRFCWSASGRVNATACTCVSWVVGYIELATGVDPMRESARASDRHAALQELRRRGGMVAAFTAELGPPAPVPVDVGPCLVRVGRRMVAGLRNRGRTILKTDGGVTLGPPPLMSWSLECPR